MAFSNVAVFGGAFLTPVVVGKLTDTLGWSWSFYLIAIIAGACFPLVFFFVPETAFKRPDYLNTDFEGDTEGMLVATGAAPHSGDSERELTANGADHTDGDPEKDRKDSGIDNRPRAMEDDARANEAHEASLRPKLTFRQSLRIFNGRKTDENFFELLLRPFPLFLHPSIIWVRTESLPADCTPR
jgi:hypothetical protein